MLSRAGDALYVLVDRGFLEHFGTRSRTTRSKETTMATTHIRRTPEEIVAEYEAKIAAVKARAAAKEAKASPEGAAFLIAVRGLQKAQVAAESAKDQPMNLAIEAALATLSAHAVETGLRMPQPRATKSAVGGRRRKTSAA